MKKKLFTFAVLLSLLWAGLFFFSQESFTEEALAEEEEEECIPCFSCSSAVCSGSVEGESGELQCGGTVIETWTDACCGESSYTRYNEGEPWQKCEPSCHHNWRCEGGCLDIPKDPRYYGEPDLEYPDAGTYDEDDVFLPVKLGWKNVTGWEIGGGPRSYRIEIEKTNENDFSKVINENHFKADNCLLKSDYNHDWRVQACCGTNGTNCGSFSDWSLETSDAPEPLEPLDPDWSGPKAAGIEPDGPISIKEANLRWCPTELSTGDDPDEREPFPYYALLVYLEKNGSKECHPELLTRGFFKKECSPIRIDPERPYEHYARSEFLNARHDFFTKLYSDDGTIYAWSVSACRDSNLIQCTEYSQEWKFAVQDTLETPSLIDPYDNEKDVSFPVTLRWSRPLGSRSFIYEFYEGGSIIHQEKTENAFSISFDYPRIKIDTEYKWRVKPCWDNDSLKCEGQWSNLSSFITAGRPPELYSPTEGELLPPIRFDWENIEGAKSFIFSLNGEERKITDASSIVLGYPDLVQQKSYSWKIKTCIDSEGTICGEWSDVENFRTGVLPPPENPSLVDEEIYSDQRSFPVSWDYPREIDYFLFSLRYDSVDPLENRAQCVPGTTIKEVIISSKTTSFSLDCLGSYSWQVTACLDEECEERGVNSDWWSFRYTEREGSKETGFIPCGQAHNNPKTPWNERESCQLKHLFIIIKIIIDFLLWNFLLLVLAAMALISVVLFYLSMGNPEVLIKVKAIWKAVGVGIIILFLGWTFISILMTVFGYRFGIYGPWWQISF